MNFCIIKLLTVQICLVWIFCKYKFTIWIISDMKISRITIYIYVIKDWSNNKILLKLQEENDQASSYYIIHVIMMQYYMYNQYLLGTNDFNLKMEL